MMLRIALIAVTMLGTALANAQPAVKVTNCPLGKVAVLDFSVAPRVVEERECPTRELKYSTKKVEAESDIQGWGVCARNVYFNPNVGRIAADLFTESLAKWKLFEPFSRSDLRYYYADKRDILRRELKLKGDDLENALLMLNPVSVGREIGVDKVIVGQICDSEVRKSRFIPAMGYFHSTVSLNMVIFDVKTGRREFQKEYANTRGRSTQYGNYDEIANQLAHDLSVTYKLGSSPNPLVRYRH